MPQAACVQRQDLFAPLCQVVKKIGIQTDAVLDDFPQTGQQLIVGQGLQQFRVDQHQAGLVKGAQDVLAQGDIHPGLAAYRTVHLGQQ